MSQTKAQLISGTATQDLTVDNIAANSLHGGQFSNRNLFINGNMLVWQRGTSGGASGSYLCDRFWCAGTGVAYARSTDAPAGFKYSAKLTYGSAAIAFGQPIELCATGSSQPMVAGEKITVSFYAKVDSGSTQASVLLKFRDSKFSSTNEVEFTSDTGNATLTTSWQRFTKTFTIPTVGGTNVMAAFELSGIDRTAYFAGFQMELGDTATAFEHRTFHDELAKCQRYYHQSYDYGTYPGANQDNGCYCVNAIQGAFIRIKAVTPCTMRARPSVTVYSTTGAANKFRNRDDNVDVNGGTTSIGMSGAGLQMEGTGAPTGKFMSAHAVLDAEF